MGLYEVVFSAGGQLLRLRLRYRCLRGKVTTRAPRGLRRPIIAFLGRRILFRNGTLVRNGATTRGIRHGVRLALLLSRQGPGDKVREFLKQQTTAFDPKADQSMIDAYDQAWAILATSDGVNDGNREKKRVALAKLIIEAGGSGATDPAKMNSHALAALGVQRPP